MNLIYFLEKSLWPQSREWIQGDRTEGRVREPWREIINAEHREVTMGREKVTESRDEAWAGLVANRMGSPRQASMPALLIQTFNHTSQLSIRLGRTVHLQPGYDKISVVSIQQDHNHKP